MTIEERKRIAIAKACGWKEYDHYPTGLFGRSERKWQSPAKGCIGQIDAPPDYLNDLNAMHEAEKVLLKVIYPSDTDVIIGDRMHDYAEHVGYAIHATAAQKADAFIKVLNLEY